MNIICFGQSNWDYCWTGKQHLMSHLARRGHRVLYVDPDWTSLERTDVDAIRALVPLSTRLVPRKLAPRLWLYAPTPSPLLPWKLERHRQRRILRRLVHRLCLHDPVVISFSPRVRHMASAVDARARLHFVTDEMTAFEGIDAARQLKVREIEDQCLRQSDVVLTVSPVLRSRIQTVQPEVHLLRGGADPERFAAARARGGPPHACLRGLAGPVIALVGQIDQRLDTALLEYVARARPDWNLLLVGRERIGADTQGLHALPNVRFAGYQPFEELPDVLRGVDVGIVPYRRTPLTLSCDPLKIYEYLAAGCPVVSTPLDGVVPFGGAVRVADGPDAFLAALDRAIERPEEDAALRRAVVEASSWERRVDDLESYLEQARRLGRRRRTTGTSAPAISAARLPFARAAAEAGRRAARPGVDG